MTRDPLRRCSISVRFWLLITDYWLQLPPTAGKGAGSGPRVDPGWPRSVQGVYFPCTDCVRSSPETDGTWGVVGMEDVGKERVTMEMLGAMRFWVHPRGRRQEASGIGRPSALFWLQDLREHAE